MMPKMLSCAIFLALMFAACAPAQQLEINSPLGSLLGNGLNPTPGTPIGVGSNDTLDLTVGGAAGSNYLLLMGSLLTSSIPIIGQALDIDPATALAVVDSFGVFPSAFPSSFAVLNSNGVSNWSFPLHPGLLGSTFAFQAAVLNPAAPAGLSLTAAPALQVVPLSISLTGDDTLGGPYTLNAPVILYGQPWSTFYVDTNGTINFGTPAFSDLSESVPDFIAGAAGSSTPGSGPMISVLWEDLDVGNNTTPSQGIQITELGPGVLQVTWVDAEYWPNSATFTVACTIDSNLGTVTLDYTGYTNGAPPTEGLVGVSDGGTAATLTGIPALATAIDIAVAGSIPGYTSASQSEVIFQNFDGAGSPSVPAEPFDLGGLVVTYIDGNGTGGFIVF